MNDPSSEVAFSDLVEYFKSDDVEGIIAAYPRLTDQARGLAWDALRPRLIVAFRQTPVEKTLSWEAWEQRTRARSLLALSIGPPDAVRLVGTGIVRPIESDLIIGSRSDEWRAAFAAAIVRCWATVPEPGMFGPSWRDWWQWVRRHQQMELLPIDETSTDYLVVMVRGLLFSGSIEDSIRRDPDLAVRPLWSLFEPRPAVQKALLGSEMFWNPANTWRVALVKLALAGVIDSERLERAAAAAASDERMGKGHRAWYRKIPALLTRPDLIPTAPEHGPPPPGNQLFPRVRRDGRS